MKSLSEIAETIQRETGAEGQELEVLADAVRDAVQEMTTEPKDLFEFACGVIAASACSPELARIRRLARAEGGAV